MNGSFKVKIRWPKKTSSKKAEASPASSAKTSRKRKAPKEGQSHASATDDGGSGFPREFTPPKKAKKAAGREQDIQRGGACDTKVGGGRKVDCDHSHSLSFGGLAATPSSECPPQKAKQIKFVNVGVSGKLSSNSQQKSESGIFHPATLGKTGPSSHRAGGSKHEKKCLERSVPKALRSDKRARETSRSSKSTRNSDKRKVDQAKLELGGCQGRLPEFAKWEENDIEVEEVKPKGPTVPRRIDLERVVDHVQKQDKNEIFKDPVTEDVAPNYFSVISKPMDFTTVRKKLDGGGYTSWQSLGDDLMTMFQNAMVYNSPNTTFHKQAKTLMQVAKKLIDLGKEGVTNFRGKTAGVVRAHNAQVAADDRAEKNAQKAAIRAQRMQMRNDKLIQKAAARGIRVPFGTSLSAPSGGVDGSDLTSLLRTSLRENDGRKPLITDENVRWTYHPPVPHQVVMKPWGGLAGGANAEGVSFGVGKMMVSTLPSRPLPPDAYVQSLVRFSKRLNGRASDYILRCAAECLP
ncbi:hypothetical protein BSKO_08304 [Bryopsis sp. KO-2023]|nr:hypothetical protein BSKO_08304 [Bryopsis sp. KO-2023]